MDVTATECVICLDTGHLIELDCGHRFHRRCILAWARVNPECPMCRSPLDGCLLEILVMEEYIRDMKTVVRRGRRERERRNDVKGFVAFIIMFVAVAVGIGFIVGFKEMY